MRLLTVTEVLRPYVDYSMVAEDLLLLAQERGTEVHRFCAAYAQGVWLPVPQGLEGYCRSFARWFDDFVGKVIAVEKRLLNPILGFSGQPDLIAELKGEEGAVVVDYKTPATEGPTWQAQVAAYIHLANFSKIPVKHGGSLKLRKDGSLARWVPCENSSEALGAFLNALHAYRYFHRKEKRHADQLRSDSRTGV